MPSVVTHKFRQNNADQFKEAFGEAAPTRMYMFIGGVKAWTNDASPPTPNDAVANTVYAHWRDMLSCKKVEASDVSYVIPRVNWTSGTLYTEYSDTNSTLFSNTFYAMVSDYHVYKCLFNNNGGLSTSTPSGTSSSIITTADGYKWKYMYTVSAADVLKYNTSSYIPVKTLSANDGSNQWSVQQAAVNGSIDIVDVTAGGSTYNNYHTGTLAAVGNTTTVTLASGASAVNDLYNGSMFYTTGGTGLGQQKEVINYVGSTKVATLASAVSTGLDGTTTYSVAPKVVLQGDGTGATAIATMNTTSNTVYSMTVTAVGQDYSQANVVVSANGSSGVTATAYIAPKTGHGKDAVAELGGFNVMVNCKFDKDEGGKFTTSNDFRKIGLLRDPLLASGTAANGATYDQTTTFGLNAVSGTFVTDERVDGGTTTSNAYIVQANSSQIKVTSQDGLFAAGETVTGNTSLATANVLTHTIGELQKFSGDILYVENRSPISRAADQIEDVKLVIQF